jgi:hypothetical protein
MQLSFFADENIPESVIKWIKTNGFNISGIRSENLYGMERPLFKRHFQKRKSSSLKTVILGRLFLQKRSSFIQLFF